VHLTYFIVLAIFVPQIIKVGENLTKVWQKQFCLCFFFGGGIRCIYRRHRSHRSVICPSVCMSVTLVPW